MVYDYGSPTLQIIGSDVLISDVGSPLTLGQVKTFLPTSNLALNHIKCTSNKLAD